MRAMNRLRTSLLLCVLFALSFSGIAYAQIPSEGRDFYLGYIYPSYNDYVAAGTGAYFKVFAYVSSFNDNYVEVSYFDPYTKKEEASTRYPIPARRTVAIQLDIQRMKMKEPGEIAGEFTSCHLKSKGPINVQFFSSGANSGGSYLALPVNAWGKEYVVASYHDNGSQSGFMPGGRSSTTFDENGGAFVVIAAYDGTNVTIIPTAQTGSGRPGVRSGPGADGTPKPYSVSLNRGQCWLVTSKSVKLGNDDDISSSIVKSNNPVAVIAGNPDAYVDGSDVYDFRVEQRDYMVEQMVPVEYWDNTGYISIPLMEAPSARDGFGEELRIYADDQNVPSVVHADLGGPQPVDMFPGTYATPPVSKIFEKPVHFYADSGKKFSVAQVDLRSHGTSRTTPPLPSPSMAMIVPRSMWRNAYLWYVPANVNEKLQAYYITVIAPKDNAELYYKPLDSVIKRAWYQDSLRVSLNGAKEQGVNVFGAPQKTWSSIPGFPELKAVTYRVSPNTSYYARAPYPFMIYHFGMRAVDVDGDLGDFDDEDMFFSYYLPLGMSLHTGEQRMSITVDTLCTGWRVCVHDSNDNVGIKSVTLLNDPNGDIIIGGHYQYKNTRFDPADDPLDLKEITKAPAPKDLCFNLLIQNPGVDAYAPLYIIDANGNSQILELRYKKQAVEFSPSDTVGIVFDKWDSRLKKLDIPYVGEDTCKEYLFVNLPTSPRSYKITKVNIPQPSPFTLKSTVPDISTNPTLNPGDTLRMSVCFTGPDTMLYLDSIEFETDCFPALLPLKGQAGTPIITATDANFGSILINSPKCLNVEVKNIGNKAFELTKEWILNNYNPGNEFTFDTTDPQNKLPRVLGPNQSYDKFKFCYSPKEEETDSARQDWAQDIPDPYHTKIKSYSILIGAGITPGITWDRPVESFVVTCDSEQIKRVYLKSIGSAQDNTLDGIWFEGRDSAEFKVVGAQSSSSPPTYANTTIPKDDSIWVDVRFKADLSKGYLPRTAFLRTRESTEKRVKTINLTGNVRHAVATLTTDIAPDTLDYTYIDVGKEECRTFSIRNDGDAPLIIESFIATGSPYRAIVPNLTPLLPFTIDIGTTMSFTICGSMDTWGDTTVPFILNYRDNLCTPSTTIYQHYSASNNVMTLGIPPHPPTYIGGCRNSTVNGLITNRSFRMPANLQSAEIVNGGPGLDNADQFTFTNGSRSISLGNKLIQPGESEQIPVVYQPAGTPAPTGPVGAILRATWDSAGTVFTSETEIHGVGVLLRNTFSVENAAGQPYEAYTNEFVTIPARITDNIAGPAGAAPPGARGATFTVKWKGDQFKFLGATGRGTFTVTPPLGAGDEIRDNATGDEMVTIHVESDAGDIVNAQDMVDMNFQVMLTKFKSTDITISNGAFTDAQGSDLCYFENQYIPGQFIQQDNCGDGTLREWMNGKKPASISYLTPNPATSGSQLKLGYTVNVPLAPVTIELFDVKGEKVRTLKSGSFSSKGDHSLLIATGGLAAGSYTVRLSSTGAAETTGFVIEK